jgi:hypothetical protein
MLFKDETGDALSTRAGMIEKEKLKWQAPRFGLSSPVQDWVSRYGSVHPTPERADGPRRAKTRQLPRKLENNVPLTSPVDWAASPWALPLSGRLERSTNKPAGGPGSARQ